MARIIRLALVSFAFFLAGCNLLESESSNASLSALAIAGATLSPEFSPGVYSYAAAVDVDTGTASVSATASNGAAAVTINGKVAGNGASISIPLQYGDNQVSVVVLSENRKRRKVYSIGITRPVPLYSIGGSVTGLAGSLTLQNNGADDLVLSSGGTFAFATEVTEGTDYEVTVSSQPAGQQCTVSNGSGTVGSADVDDIAVSCASQGSYRVSGYISGLVGTGMLQLNGSSELLMTKNGQFVFGPAFAAGAAYAVTVATQPDGQSCAVSNGSGVFPDSNVVDVAVVCSGAGTVTSSIFDWEWVNPLPQGNTIYGFASDGSQLVAVGTNGLVQTSADGINWTRRDAGMGESLLAVARGGGEYVAVGDSGTIINSADGVTWQTATTVPFAYLREITWSGSRYVVVGSDNLDPTMGVIATSPDGDAWTVQRISLTDGFALSGVSWNGSVFAAIQSTDYVYTSADGVTWTATRVDAGANLFQQAIASDGGRFVLITADGLVYTSVDNGSSWTAETETLVGLGPFAIYWDGSRFVVPGINGQYASSADATSWTTTVVDAVADPFLLRGTRFGGLNILAANSGALYTSPDDMSWTTAFSSAYYGMWDVIWDGSQFISAGLESTIRTSPDGSTWTTRYTATGATMLAITQGGGQYVAVGSGSSGQVLTSPDAITWTPHSAAMSSLQLGGVAWGNGQYVAVGRNQSGTILTSPDGVTWTPQTAGLIGDERLYGVAYNGSIWAVTGYRFAGGLESFIATSADGVSWTKQVLPNWLYFEGIAWNGNRFVATNSGSIGTSSDGLNWSILQTTAQVKDITWTGSEFLVAGFGSDILSSADGLDWFVFRTPSGSYNGIAANATTTVVLDFDGKILTRTIP